MSKPEGEVAWVIGGSTGLGLAIAAALLEADYRVTLFARSLEGLERGRAELLAQYPEADSRLAIATLDATSRESVEAVFAEEIAKCERLDVLVNAIGQSCRTTVDQPDWTLYQRMMDINYHAVVHTTLTALPWLLASGGTIANIASLSGLAAWPWIAPYGAAKSALINFSNSLRLEKQGQIGVLVVCPGPIQRSDAGQRYADQAAALDAKANRPGANAPVKALSPEWLSKQIVRAIRTRRPQLIYPFKVRLLMIAQAISARLGHWVLTKLNRP